MKIEHKVALVLYEARSAWLTSSEIQQAIERRWPPKPLFGRWGPRWRGIVGTGSLFRALDRLARDGRVERKWLADRARYRLCA